MCTNIPSLSSKSKHQGNGHHFAAIAERGFRNAAATAVLELMQEHGYSRERAVCALLHEISSSGQTANSTRPTDDKVRNTRSIDQGLACYPCVFAGCSRVFEIDLSQTLRTPLHLINTDKERVTGRCYSRSEANSLKIKHVSPNILQWAKSGPEPNVWLERWTLGYG